MQGKKPLNIAIGRRIQQSREQAGLTQEELAERIDRSTQFISTIERGLAGPSLETVIHLCEVLGTSTEWILRGRALLPDSNLLAASVMEKLSGLSPAQLLLVDRMTSDLIKLLQMKESSNMEELIDASPSPQHRCMKFTGRLQSLWPLACQDKTGSHSPVLCPPEIISPEVYPIGQPLFTNASLHRMLKHRIP